MTRHPWPIGPMLCIALLCGPALGAGDAAPGGTPPAAQQPAEPDTGDDAAAGDAAIDGGAIDGEAMDMLMRMADTLAQAKGFTVTINDRFDVVQDDGEKIEFGDRRNITLTRPDGLRVEAEQSDGTKTLVTYDGKAVTVFKPDQNVYGQTDKAGSVDDAIRFVVRDLQIRVPLAMLLVTTLPDELGQRLQALDYVERDTLTPVPTDHLAGRTEDVDFQVWIPAEGPPLPQRITITYKNDEGEPQYRADLTNWVLDPSVAPDQLAFTPPAGAERIPFLVRVPREKTGRPPSDSTEGAPK